MKKCDIDAAINIMKQSLHAVMYAGASYPNPKKSEIFSSRIAAHKTTN